MDAIIPINLTQLPAALDLLHVCLIGLSLLLLMAWLLAMRSRSDSNMELSSNPLRSANRSLSGVEANAGFGSAQPAGDHAQWGERLKNAPDTALQLLAMLQREARFIDFIEEDISDYRDADIGAAVRAIHAGCRKVITTHVQLEPIRHEAEGARIALPEGFDASAVRLSGQVVGTAPYRGVLVHRGWRVTKLKLPQRVEGYDLRILTPAEVEL